jgi:hypothetical protein
MDGLVRLLHMQGVTVRIGIDGDGSNPQLPCRFDNPAGNLAAIGDEYLPEHCYLPLDDKPTRLILSPLSRRPSQRGRDIDHTQAPIHLTLALQPFDTIRAADFGCELTWG